MTSLARQSTFRICGGCLRANAGKGKRRKCLRALKVWACIFRRGDVHRSQMLFANDECLTTAIVVEDLEVQELLGSGRRNDGCLEMYAKLAEFMHMLQSLLEAFRNGQKFRYRFKLFLVITLAQAPTGPFYRAIELLGCIEETQCVAILPQLPLSVTTGFLKPIYVHRNADGREDGQDGANGLHPSGSRRPPAQRLAEDLKGVAVERIGRNFLLSSVGSEA